MPVDISSAQALVASIQNTIQIVKAILGARDAMLERQKTAELSEKLFTMLGHAMSVQAELATAKEEIAGLKARIVQMEEWAQEKQRYELKELRPGVFAYFLKETHAGGEPAHAICANCYQDGVKRILQEEHLAVGRTHVLICSRCGAELVKSGLRQADHPRPKPRGR